MYKLLIVKNRYNKKLDLSKGLEWFKLNTPLSITTEEIETDFDVTTEKVITEQYKAVIVGDDIYPKLRTIIPEGKYHAVVFIYGNKVNGVRMNATKHLPLYPGTDLIQLCTLTDYGRSLNHEIFHTFFHRLNRQQVVVEDPMDVCEYKGIIRKYFNNSSLDAKPSNRSIALERLAPHWAKIQNIMTTNPIVTLTRNTYTDNETLGELSYNGFTCKTLERAWKNNLPNISCIPKGTYKVKYTFSPKFLKYTYEIQSVPNRTGIRIHSGNFFYQIQGCILLGTGYSNLDNDNETDVINSKITVNSFEALLNKRDFTLIIT